MSLLFAVSKLFEIIVMETLTFHTKQYISEDQHGFVPNRSTATNLLSITTYVTDSLAERSQTDAIYTDLTSAFDMINHDIAVAKLERLGLTGSLLRWFQSYLTGRHLKVEIGDYFSASFTATSGIPQGSHLGPLIFLLYFNDVNFAIEGPRLSFADDLKIFLRIQSLHDALFLQQQLNTCASWCETNRMILNPNKCSVISFSRKRHPIIFDYTLAGVTLHRDSHVKDLGVILDSQLNFKQHMNYVIDKASRQLGFIFRTAKTFTDIYCLKALYCSLVRSTLEYCSTVWNPYYHNGTERVESVQRRFIRFALRRLPWQNPWRLPSYESRCQLIHLESLKTRRDVARALLVADALQARLDCPSLLQRLNIQARSRALRNNTVLRIPFRRTNYAANSALNGLQRTFNRVSEVFDFHHSRGTLRNKFTAFLSRS